MPLVFISTVLDQGKSSFLGVFLRRQRFIVLLAFFVFVFLDLAIFVFFNDTTLATKRRGFGGVV